MDAVGILETHGLVVEVSLAGLGFVCESVVGRVDALDKLDKDRLVESKAIDTVSMYG